MGDATKLLLIASIVVMGIMIKMAQDRGSKVIRNFYFDEDKYSRHTDPAFAGANKGAFIFYN